MSKCAGCNDLYEIRLRAEEAERRDEVKAREMAVLRTALQHAIDTRNDLAWKLAETEALMRASLEKGVSYGV